MNKCSLVTRFHLAILGEEGFHEILDHDPEFRCNPHLWHEVVEEATKQRNKYFPYRKRRFRNQAVETGKRAYFSECVRFLGTHTFEVLVDGDGRFTKFSWDANTSYSLSKCLDREEIVGY